MTSGRMIRVMAFLSLLLSGLLHSQDKVWVDFDRKGQRLQEQGRYRSAEQYFLKAFQAAEASLGPKDPNTVVIQHNLALNAAAQGKYTEAERLLRRTLSDLQASLGPDHPLVAENLNSLGSLYFRLRRFRDAECVFERGLAIRGKAVPRDPICGCHQPKQFGIHLSRTRGLRQSRTDASAGGSDV